jgi:hypothetical protein
MRCPSLTRASVVALAAMPLLTAGCGGGSPRTAANTPQAELVAYSHCMRTHGVASFPDPTSSGQIPKDQIVPLVGTPQFAVAEKACQHFMPNGRLGVPTGQQASNRRADALSFARCMRSHGVTRFPDPTPQGELSVAMVQAQGIDVHAPAVLQAVQGCLPASHGFLTAAKVERALRDAGP